MVRSTTSLVLAVGLPPLLLAGLGFIHPAGLDAASAEWWHKLHIILLPIFPLLGFAPWILVRPIRQPLLTIATAALGLVYGAFYTALDVLAGIGAGRLELLGIHAPVEPLFAQGEALAAIGTSAYLIATLLAAGSALVLAGWAALPGTLLVCAGAISFLTSHIFWPRGVVTMLALALGWVALALALRRSERAAASSPATPISGDYFASS